MWEGLSRMARDLRKRTAVHFTQSSESEEESPESSRDDLASCLNSSESIYSPVLTSDEDDDSQDDDENTFSFKSQACVLSSDDSDDPSFELSGKRKKKKANTRSATCVNASRLYFPDEVEDYPPKTAKRRCLRKKATNHIAHIKSPRVVLRRLPDNLHCPSDSSGDDTVLAEYSDDTDDQTDEKNSNQFMGKVQVAQCDSSQHSAFLGSYGKAFTDSETENQPLGEQSDDPLNGLVRLLQKSNFYSNLLNEKMKKQKQIENENQKRKHCAGIIKSDKLKKIPYLGNNTKSKSRVKDEDIADLLFTDDDDDDDEEYQSSQDSAEERFFEGLPIPPKQPMLLSGGVMRQYQPMRWAWGKTIQTISLICHLYEQDNTRGPFLVIAPLSTLYNWKREFNQFAPSLPVSVFYGDKKQRQELKKTICKASKLLVRQKKKVVHPVLITSYDTARIELGFLKKFCWTLVVIDEGHKIKNFQTLLGKALRKISSKHRLLLTGTPLQNNLKELWTLLNYLMGNIFDDLKLFESWFKVEELDDDQIVHQENQDQIIAKMHQILAPFLLRRTKNSVKMNLPKKKELLVYCPMTPLQQELYKSLADKSMSILLTKLDKKPAIIGDLNESLKMRQRIKKIDYNEDNLERDFNTFNPSLYDKEVVDNVFHEEKKIKKEDDFLYFIGMKNLFRCQNVVMHLRKVTNHPFLVRWPKDEKTKELVWGEELIKSSGKMQVLDLLLENLKIRSHRVLIFSQMTKVLDMIEELCDQRSYTYFRLDGASNLERRLEMIESFNKKECDKFIFLISTRAGGLRINLIGADTCIIFDSDWNPQDRCHRIGQTKPVIVYRLVTADTVDEAIVKRANNKRKLEKMIIHGMEKEFNTETLLQLLQSTDYAKIMKYSENMFHRSLFTKEELEMLLDRSDMNAEENVADVGKVAECI